MNTYQQNLINEHKEISIKVNALHNYIYSGESLNNDNPIEYANKCIQLRGMKMYEEALCARLTNTGVIFENGNYFEQVDALKAPSHTDVFVEVDIAQPSQDGSNE